MRRNTLVRAAVTSLVAWVWTTPGCKSAPLEMEASQPAQQSMDAGGTCAPLAAQQDVDAIPSTAPSCAADAGVAPFDFQYPLGLSYHERPTDLPDHVAYLTFDDGPSDWTNDFLDILRAQSVHATFFVTARQFKGSAGLAGSYVDEHGQTETYGALLKREVQEGHVLGNHSVNHPDFGQVGPTSVESELDENELLVNQALVENGGDTRILSLVRPPFGSPWFSGLVDGLVSPENQQAIARPIARHGINVLWNVTSEDSKEWVPGESFSRTRAPSEIVQGTTYDQKVQRTINNVLQNDYVGRGAGIIVLMHDTHVTTKDALVTIIEGLRTRGYRFDTIESYVQSRWGRPSYQVAPGPALYSPCVDPSEWGCSSAGPGMPQVCGRMWRAMQAFGGQAALGDATAPASQSASGAVSQSFQHGTLVLHPELPPPCQAVFVSGG